MPNALSASRILAVPLLVDSIVSARWGMAMGTLAYCSATDMVSIPVCVSLSMTL